MLFTSDDFASASYKKGDELGNQLDTAHLHVKHQVGDSVMQLLQGVGCQGGGGLPSVHLHGTLTLGLLGPDSRLYRGGTPRRSLDWLGWLGILAFGRLGMRV